VETRYNTNTDNGSIWMEFQYIRKKDTARVVENPQIRMVATLVLVKLMGLVMLVAVMELKNLIKL
jgi:hypothetical protein